MFSFKAIMVAARCLAISAIILLQLLYRESAVAAEGNYDDLSQPMKFASAETGGNCRTCSWLAATGTITQETPEAFEAVLAIHKSLGTVVINSLGGDLIAGIKLG